MVGGLSPNSVTYTFREIRGLVKISGGLWRGHRSAHFCLIDVWMPPAFAGAGSAFAEQAGIFLFTSSGISAVCHRCFGGRLVIALASKWLFGGFGL